MGLKLRLSYQPWRSKTIVFAIDSLIWPREQTDQYKFQLRRPCEVTKGRGLSKF